MAVNKQNVKLRDRIAERAIFAAAFGADNGPRRLLALLEPSELDAALSRLCSQLGVEKDDWKTLAIMLAYEGGFLQIEKATGPIPHWSKNMRVALVLAVDHWAHANGKSVTATFKDKGFREAWGEASGQVDRAGTLSTRYYETRAADDPLLWAFDKLKSEAPGEYWEHAAGLVDAFTKQAKIDKLRERQRREIATDM